MNKEKITKFLRSTKRTISKHSPEILTGIGIAGMVTTTVLAVKATPKALELIEEKKREKNYELVKEAANGDDSCERINKLSPIETVRVAWKPYIPAVVTGTLSIVCLVGASSTSARRNAALATAYKISETALSEYKAKVVETIGEKKEESIRDKIAKDKVEKNPVSKTEIIITEKGNTLCYDALSGRYFKSDIDRIKKAENAINKRLLNEMYISLNEFYDELGLGSTSIGDELGWNLDDGLIDLDFSSQIADDGTPCIVVDYRVAPKYNYYKFA